MCKHQWASSIIEDATDLARFLRSHQWITAKLREKNAKVVIMHCSTRFAGAYYTMRRLLELKKAIREIVVDDEFEKKKYEGGKQAYDLAISTDLWKKMETLLGVLQPVKDFIRMMDSNRHMTEHFHHALLELESEWEEMKLQKAPGFKSHCLRQLKQRWKWMEFPIHLAAHALSPYYVSDHLFSNRRVMPGAREILFHYSDNNAAIEKDFTDFKNYRKNNHDIPFPTRAANRNDPTVLSSKAWWQLYGSQWPKLQQVAIRVFSVGTSTSTSERNWSTFGHIWNSRSANRKFNSAAQVAYCNFNLNAIYQTGKEKSEGALCTTMANCSEEGGSGSECESESDDSDVESSDDEE